MSINGAMISLRTLANPCPRAVRSRFFEDSMQAGKAAGTLNGNELYCFVFFGVLF